SASPAPTERPGPSQSLHLTDPASLAAFQGNGTVSVSDTASATASASGPGNLLAMIRTVAEGKVKVVYHYTPSDELRPGMYQIVQTQQPPGFLDGKDTAGNQAPIPNSDHTDVIAVTLPPGGNSSENCFGELPAGSIGGLVYHDQDRSGNYGSGDVVLGGVTVTLNGFNDLNEAVNQTMQTNAFGQYLFTGLRPGNYAITETQPGGYDQ